MRGGGVEVTEDVAALHARAFVFDLHNDLLTKLSHLRYDLSREHKPATFWNPLRLDLDLPRMLRGGVSALGCVMFGGFRLARRRRFWRELDCARSLVAAHPAALALATHARELAAARSSGRVGLLLGVEGSHAIDRDVEGSVSKLAAAGVRFVGPLWERDSACGSSCRSRSASDRGLTDLGRVLVRACDAAGLRMDVAHASRKTFWDMAETSAHPLFSSHSGAAAVCAHPRNLDDDQLREIGRRGGVVGAIFVSSYIGGTLTATLHDLANHVEHIARVAGEGAVALGSDFDGFMPLVRGMRDVADLPRLTQVLWDRGWREPELRRLLGENALRYFGAPPLTA